MSSTDGVKEFLEARLEEDEEHMEAARRHYQGYYAARLKRELEAKRRILAFHDRWPVLVEESPKFSLPGSPDFDARTVTFQVTQKLAWLTEQEYRARFGTEPPTAPMVLALAAVYADHPDYREEWAPAPEPPAERGVARLTVDL